MRFIHPGWKDSPKGHIQGKRDCRAQNPSIPMGLWRRRFLFLDPMGLAWFNIQGSQPYSPPRQPHQNSASIRFIKSSFNTTNMPRNRISNNLDYVKKDPKPQREFRIQLISQLFERSKRLSGRPYAIKTSLLSRVYPAASVDYSGQDQGIRTLLLCWEKSICSQT